MSRGRIDDFELFESGSIALKRFAIKPEGPQGKIDFDFLTENA